MKLAACLVTYVCTVVYKWVYQVEGQQHTRMLATLQVQAQSSDACAADLGAYCYD